MQDSTRPTPTKFSPRPLGPYQLDRDRLLGVLEHNAHAKLVLIDAPAGYGKTTLMAQWRCRLYAAGQGTGWIWLDEDDNNVGRFGSILSQALLPDSGGGVDLFDSVTRCLEAHSRFTLFLDEEEHLSSPDAIHLLEILLDSSPDALHLVVGSRHRPQRLATRLRMRNDFLELTARDLAFLPQEITQFMHRRCGIDLDAGTNDELARRTEGWAAALQLAAVEIAQGELPREVCLHLATPHSDLFRYLSDEVLSQLSPEQQRFLQQTSFLSELSGDLCDAVTGRSDSEAVLLQLEQANLLLQPVDLSRRRFRYHALFADVLRQQLRAERGAELGELARRAAAWCARSGRSEEAVEYALLAADAELLVALMAACIEGVIARGQFATARRWLLAIAPEQRRQHADLMIWSAWVDLYSNDFAAVEVALANLEQLNREHPFELRQRLGTVIVTVLYRILHRRYDEAVSATESASAQLPPDRHLQARFGNLRGLLAQTQGRFGDSAQQAERVLALASQTPPLWLSLVHAAHIAGLTELSLGNLASARHQFQMPERAITAHNEAALTDVSPSQLALLAGARALVLYELNQLDDAEDCLDRHAPFLNSVFTPAGRMLWYQMSARLRALRGGEHYRAVLREGSAYAVRHDIGWMQSALQWEQVDQDLARQDLNHARSIAPGLLSQLSLDQTPQWIASCEEVFGPVISAIRYLIHSGESRRALQYLPLHLAQAQQQLRRLRLTKLRILQALALETLEQHAEALQAMRAAVELGHQSGAIRSFADEGPRCLALLQQLDRERSRAAPVEIRAYLQRLLAAFDGSEGMGEAPLPQLSPAPGSSPLSARESQILQQLAQGHSNLMLGQQLFLSPNTVKWHLSQIYAKLGVRNRTQAIHYARQHNLTPLP